MFWTHCLSILASPLHPFEQCLARNVRTAAYMALEQILKKPWMGERTSFTGVVYTKW